MEHLLNVFYIKLFCFSSELIETWGSCSIHKESYNKSKFYQILMENKKVSPLGAGEPALNGLSVKYFSPEFDKTL